MGMNVAFDIARSMERARAIVDSEANHMYSFRFLVFLLTRYRSSDCRGGLGLERLSI